MTRRLEEAAWRDALRDMALDEATIPHPSATAAYLPLYLANALLEATLGPEGYKVAPRHRDELFARGLVGARTHYLTAYGHSVRRVLKEDEK